MTMYLPDGSVISSSVPRTQKKEQEHRRMYGIYRGLILRSVYPDDPNNSTKERMEYVVKVRGQVYSNAINLREAGGIYNYKERIRKGVEKSASGQISESTFDELLDGEHVFVAFLEGYGNAPIILGGSEHPQHAKYKKPVLADGLFDVYEFNGVEIKIDNDGNYTITNTGKKDKDGNILNPDAVGTFFKIGSDGHIELNNGASKIKISNDGILIQDEFGNTVEMKDGEVSIVSSGKVNLTAPDDVSLQSDGQATLVGQAGTDVGSGSSTTNVNGQQVNLAGGGLGVARLNDTAVGIGNLGGYVISRIFKASQKVKSG
jgi:hypothetical protein